MKNKKCMFLHSKKRILFVIVILFIVLCILSTKNVIKKQKNGNNMNSQEIVDKILNLNSYKAKIKVQVNSNKKQNKYILYQEYNMEEGCVQEVIEPENISGIKITRKENCLKLENSKLDLNTVFENYHGLENNSLDLINFVSEFKENDKSSYEEKKEEIIMKVKPDKENKYINNKILYINKQKALPTKLIIQDNNQNTTIFIEYIEVELN